MSRTLSTATAAAVVGPVTAPGYFAEILFATPHRSSSRGTVAWGGNTWQAWDLRVSGLALDATASSQTGQLLMGNTDFSLGVQILNEGIADRVINIWKYYTDTPGASDPVQIFSGVGTDVSIEAKRDLITISLAPAGGQTAFTPRRYITAEQGFSGLPSNGQVVSWNNEVFTLQRSG